MTPEQAAKVAALAARCDALAEDMYALTAEIGHGGEHGRMCAACVIDGAAERVEEARIILEGAGR